MNRNGPIVVLEDDIDDQTMILEIFRNLGYSNNVICFANGNDAFDFLNKKDTLPFIILSDLNMPMIDGLQVRMKIFMNENLRMKCVPYIFFTTSDNNKSVIAAYDLGSHGYFVKPTSFADFEYTLKIIVEYWKRCIVPNQQDCSAI